MQLGDIDWSVWTPRDRATLLFVVKEGQILLIRKKRGLGAGKINAPGGRIEAGETPTEAAVREVIEEVGVTPREIHFGGELKFQFVDGYSLQCYVFRAGDCDGELIETDEATPMWTALESIPFDEMWEDDALWLPMLLDGQAFQGRFVFDGDKMLDHHFD